MSVHRLILGTAAIGLDRYGIANVTGKPDDKVVEAMFQEAADAGIRWLDTARAYGDAELRIRDHTSGLFRICTKLAPHCFENLGAGQSVAGETARGLEEAQKRLGKAPDCVLLHSAEYAMQPAILGPFLATCARWGMPLRGVSCYTPEQALRAMSLGANAIQVPLNLLDLRAIHVFPVAERQGVTVFCRAPFCQGALVPGGFAHLPKAMAPAKERIAYWLARCDERKVPAAVAALSAALEAAGTFRVVFGAETVAQVEEDCDAASWRITGGFNAFRKLLGGLDNAVTNPSLWEKKDAKPTDG